MMLYSFAEVDWEIARDDAETILDLLPRKAWHSQKEVIDYIEVYRLDCHNALDKEDQESWPYEPIKWEVSTHDTDWLTYEDEGSGVTWVIFSIEV